MGATAMMTVRIDPALLSALRERAKREGRSVSAEVVRLIRRELEPAPTARRKPGSTMGMFPDFDAPPLATFKRLRREMSATIARRMQRDRRTK